MTHVDIAPDVRAAMCEELNITMGTAIDLYTQVKQAHWNIKGPWFVSRHLLFDDLASHLRAWSDELAERISTLGGYAYGTARCAADKSMLSEYNLDAVDGKTHLQALVAAYGAFTKRVRAQIADLPEPRDVATEDILIEMLRGAEKDMWFVESHLNV